MAEQYWFNTRTKEVEVGRQALAIYRIGPFKSREEAEQAYEILRARSEQWEQEEQED
jgi:hypothetical protein